MALLRRRQHVRVLLSQAEKVKLRELIERVERETTGEICVVLLHAAEDPRKFALDYFNHLGIGKKELDNGILILVVLAQRRIELVIGDGLRGIIPQTFLDRVIAETLAPRFRDGKFGDGLHQALEAFERVLHENLPKAANLRKLGQLPSVVDLEPGEHQ